MASVILGNWTHRRGDAGGCRAIAADVAGAKPRVAWSWSPPHGGRVDQVRIVGDHVFAATLGPIDPLAAGWEHVVVYALDAARGTVVATRTLADPVPVAAMVADDGVLHLVGTRSGEPVFWYALALPTLVPVHRRLLPLAADARQADVLDAWASPDGGLWLEIEAAGSATESPRRSFAFVSKSAADRPADVAAFDTAPTATGHPRDGCVAGRALFAPTFPLGEALSVLRLEPDTPIRSSEWMRSEVVGRPAALHTCYADGAVSVMALACSGERVHVQATLVDGATGVVRVRSRVEHGFVKQLGAWARMARRPNGELVLQRIGADGAPCSDLLCALPDGSITSFKLGAARPYVLDLALGDALLAHRSPKQGHVILSAFGVLEDGGWLGRRTSTLWSLELPTPGGEAGDAAVYAGAGHVIVRSPHRLTAIRV